MNIFILILHNTGLNKLCIRNSLLGPSPLKIIDPPLISVSQIYYTRLNHKLLLRAILFKVHSDFYCILRTVMEWLATQTIQLIR